jgi:aminodeoxyfutalosine deaminase
VIVLHACWVLPVDRPPLRDACVAVRDGRVEWVGPAAEAPRGDALDLGPGVLVPGLVNAHCHLELSHLRGRVSPEGGFVEWVEHIVAARGEDPPDTVRAGVVAGIDELERTGTAGVGDVSNTLAHLDLLGRSSLRARVFFELIGWDPAAAAGIVERAQERLATLGPFDGVGVSLAAHAPHSVSPALLRAMALSGGVSAIHLAESRQESRFLDTGDPEWSAFLGRRGLAHVSFEPPGLSPVRYLDSLGVLGPGLLAAHAVQTDAADRALLAMRGVSVVLCPRSNETLGVGPPRVPELRAAGVRMCLGTDSLASAPSLDLWEEARALHRAFPSLEPEWLLRAATRHGADALGLADLGGIGKGARASLAFAEGPRALADPLAFLLSTDARLHGVRA